MKRPDVDVAKSGERCDIDEEPCAGILKTWGFGVELVCRDEGYSKTKPVAEHSWKTSKLWEGQSLLEDLISKACGSK